MKTYINRNGVKASVLAQALDTQRARAVTPPVRHDFGGLQMVAA